MDEPGLRMQQEARCLMRSPRFRRKFAGWRTRFPALEILEEPEALLGLRRCPPHVREGVLAAMVTLVGESDADAPLLLLELLRPGIALRAGWFGGTLTPDEAWQEMIAAVLETARRLDPVSCRRAIARELLYKAWRHVAPIRRRHVERRSAEASLTEILEEERAEVWADPLPSARMLIAQAAQAGAISPEDALLVEATRLEGATLEEAAPGHPYHQAWKRRRLAETQLSEFARANYPACVKKRDDEWGP